MAILSCYLMPHPAIMIEEVGGRETQKVAASVKAADTVAREIKELAPDTIVIISPHGPVFYDALCIYDFPLRGSLADFGVPQIKMDFVRDDELKEELLTRAEHKDIPATTAGKASFFGFGINKKLDHGVTVPLYFVTKHFKEFKLLPIAFGMLPYEELYAFGRLIRESAEALAKKVVVIASGDLSHRLTYDAPAGYDVNGRIFDNKLVEILKTFDIKALKALEPSLIERAGECGLRSIWTMAGALDGYRVKSEVLSYEGPFGVGYCIARFKPDGRGDSILQELYQQRRDEIDERRAKEDPYVRLARYTLETYVREGRIPELPDDLPEEMLSSKAGVFVSIKKHGQLRGCIGTYLPTRKNIAEEIQRNAIAAGYEDPRFYPVGSDELEDLEYSVDVLTKPQPVDSKDMLDPKKYGVIVRKGARSGLLLPDLEGVDTVEEQLRIVLAKAGIRPDEKYQIERFEVIRHV
ncbi:MAG: AmmeMemoRadiSam system protein A [Tepidanaerobacteraceae bacterium]|nr:AmmeMemoRadiSam system protein A [Tepidanaerobacter sp.]HQE04796.1 AmmeMemoRadiSam system protein A [Tepidanaerobacteraceae bacterium]